MTKQELRVSESQSGQTVWQPSWRALVLISISVVMVVFTWLYTQIIAPTPNLAQALGLMTVHALLTVIIERATSSLPVSRGWCYRIAFFGSLAVFIIHWLVILISSTQSLGLLLVLPVALGAFCGGLLVTSLEDKFWEDNSPPSDSIQLEVHQRHLEIIGVPDPTMTSKRLFDFFLAYFGLLISMPIWLLGSFLVWIEDPGPLLFVKNSVGMGGINFRQLKFRTMVRGAEENTGPVIASEVDERVLVIGRLLRKTALDELPQLINILHGEMSFVGPRPQRTVLVRDYLERMPEYAERHRVLPGLAGLAQVAGDYYLTPRQKLRYDRLYISYADLCYDLKLIFLAFAITFWYRWQKDWDGRIPRKLIRWGS